MSDGWTFHGGRLSEARALFGDGDEPWLDLSTGINPTPWPGADDMPVDWRRLPDEAGLRDLEAAAAAHFGVDPLYICAVPGTEIGLRMLGAMLPGGGLHVAPTYRTHGAIFPGSRPVPVTDLPLAAGNIVLANPNNPDGRILSRDRLHDQLAQMAGSAGRLIVDEAFADAVPDISLAAQVGDDRPLILFRSFGKFFGLAGVRLGFVLGPRTLVAGYRAALGSWPVSSAALAIGTAAYRDRHWIAAMREALFEQAEALDVVLRRHGLSPIGACPLFRLIETDDAGALFDRLARRAILTRPFDYQPRWLRIGLPGSAEALTRLDRALGDG